jgi:hypothetical protein
MPFAIADLGALACALIAFLLAMFAAVLVGWLSRNIPNPCAFGFHPLGFIQGMLGDLHDWLVSTGDSSLLMVRDLLADLAFIDNWLVHGTVSVFVHAFALIDHLDTVVIPEAVSVAVHDLTAALQGNAFREQEDHAAALAAAAAAALATKRVADEIGHVRHGTVEGDVAAADNDATAKAGTYTNTKIAALSSDIAAHLTTVWNAIGPLQVAVATTLPDEIAADAARAASDEAADARTAAANLATTAANLTHNLASVKSQLSAAIDTATAAAAATSAADLATAEGRAQAAASSAAAAVAASSAQALAAQATALQDQIDAAQAEIAKMAATETITMPVPADVAASSTITIPLAVAGLAAAVAAITTEVDNCMVSACPGSPNNWINLLQNLVGAASLADILAFIAMAAKDPQGEAAAFSSVASGLYTEGHALIDDLLAL